MRTMLLLALLLAGGALLFTKGLYVEWAEMIVVVLASCMIAVIIHAAYGKRNGFSRILAAFSAFGLYWAFSLFDLTSDHYLYYLPQEGVFYDGRPLTLGEKMNEFVDDLFVWSWVAPLVSGSLSLLFARSKT